MKRVKTAELIGPALDWAVAKCAGREIDGFGRYGVVVWELDALTGDKEACCLFTPSTHWTQGGPIIEHEKLCVGYQHQLDPAYVPLLDPATVCWARTTAGGYLKYGPTPLIAAMRCYASKLGDEVDVPDELTS